MYINLLRYLNMAYFHTCVAQTSDPGSTQLYLTKVRELISYMHQVILIMQPEMYINTYEGTFVSQIYLMWKCQGFDSLAHGNFYICNNAFVDKQITCVKRMFTMLVYESEVIADSPFLSLLKF